MSEVQNKYFKQKQVRVAYLDLNPKAASISSMQLEKQLSLVAEITIHTIQSIDQLNKDYNLILVNALSYDEESFNVWLTQFIKRMESKFTIWTPALLLAEVDSLALHDLFRTTYQSNWYFDVIHPEHIESIPIRLANLIKITDHIYELYHYEHKLDKLQSQVDELQNNLNKYQTANKNGS